MSHGPFVRDPAAIAVIKERGGVDRRLYAVTFDDFEGNWWFGLVAAERSERGWVAHGVAGGSNGPAKPDRGTPRPSSVGSRPWLNLCGQWGGETFYAGGNLDAAGAEIGRVKLTLDDGSQLEDDGIADVSLFIGHHGERRGLLTSTHLTARCSQATTRDQKDVRTTSRPLFVERSAAEAGFGPATLPKRAVADGLMRRGRPAIGAQSWTATASGYRGQITPPEVAPRAP
jgi:hypothetical protein